MFYYVIYFIGNGSTVYVDDTMKEITDLSGPDLDNVYQVSATKDNVFTSCRDGRIRVYSVSDL